MIIRHTAYKTPRADFVALQIRPPGLISTSPPHAKPHRIRLDNRPAFPGAASRAVADGTVADRRHTPSALAADGKQDGEDHLVGRPRHGCM